MTKKCKGCGENKKFSEFWKKVDSADGFRHTCKVCHRAKTRGNYYSKHEDRKAYRHAYYLKNKAASHACSRKFSQENPAKVEEAQRKYRRSEHGLKQRREHRKNRLRVDREFLLSTRIRERVSKFVRGRLSAIKELGCSLTEFKIHLECQFQPGMSWENYGEWELDHVRPLCHFNLQDDEQFKTACHYSNLAPLWRAQNRKKGGAERRVAQ